MTRWFLYFLFCIVLTYFINFSHSAKKTSFLCSHLIEIFVPLQKVLTLDYKNKNYFLFCIVLT